ncbi:MAG: hypothetical protein ABI175_24135, partial [Polyangiales bacterium]
GPRYITAMLPFVLPLVAAQLQAWRERPLVLGAAAGTIVVGVVVYGLTTVTFPYWPDSLKNPLFEVTFRMIGDNLYAPNLGSAFGIAGIVGALPYFALVFGTLEYALIRAATWRGMLIAVVVGAAFLAGVSQLPRSGSNGERVYGFVKTAVLDL